MIKPPNPAGLDVTLRDFVSDLRREHDVRAGATILHRSAIAAGLSHVSVVADVSHPDAPRDEQGESLVELLGWPAAFIDYWLQRRYSERSAGALAARFRHLPFVWPTSDQPNALPLPDASGQAAMLGTLGITGGVMVPVRLPRGRFAVVSWLGPIGRDRAEALVDEVGPEFLLLAHYFLRLMRKSSETPAVIEDLARMTPRELECLTLIAKGDSDTEAGRALGLSVRTVRFHLRNAAEKLGARSRSHAVALATQLGVIGSVF